MPSPAHIRSTIAAIAAPPDELRAVAAYYKALADPTRLRILQRLGRGPGDGHRPDRARRPVAAARLVAPSPPQGGRAGRDARPGREVICTIAARRSTLPARESASCSARRSSMSADADDLRATRRDAEQRLIRARIEAPSARVFMQGRADAQHADAHRLRHRRRRPPGWLSQQSWLLAGIVVALRRRVRHVRRRARPRDGQDQQARRVHGQRLRPLGRGRRLRRHRHRPADRRRDACWRGPRRCRDGVGIHGQLRARQVGEPRASRRAAAWPASASRRARSGA